MIGVVMDGQDQKKNHACRLQSETAPDCHKWNVQRGAGCPALRTLAVSASTSASVGIESHVGDLIPVVVGGGEVLVDAEVFTPIFDVVGRQ